MRVIKFRAWDKENGCYVKLREHPQLVLRLSGTLTEGSTTPDYILEQFTNLCGKAGRDLDWWEGDVFKMHGWSIPWVIVKDQGCFWFKCLTTSERRLAYRVAEYAIQTEKVGTTLEQST